MDDAGLFDFHRVRMEILIENEFGTRGRSAFQGELLRLYLLVFRPVSDPPPAEADPDVLQAYEVEETRKSEDFKARWTSHTNCSNLKVDLQLLREEEEVLRSSVSTGIRSDLERAAERNAIPPSSVLMRRGSSVTLATAKSAFTVVQSESRSTPSSSMTLSNAGESTAPSVITDVDLGTSSQPDVTYLVQVLISVKPEFIGIPLKLAVSVSASALALSGIKIYSDVLSKGISNGKDSGHERVLGRLYNLSRSAISSVPPRRLQKVITVIQPIEVRAHHVELSGTTCVCIQVENINKDLAVTLHDVQFHLNSTRRVAAISSLQRCLSDELPNPPSMFAVRPASEEMHNIPDIELDIASHFRAYFKNESFPIELLPGEQQNFILCIEETSSAPKSVGDKESLTQQPSAISSGPVGNFRSLLTVAWNNNCMDGTVIAQNTLTWSRSGASECGLMLSLTGESPVSVRKIFCIFVNIINVSGQERDITLLMPRNASFSAQLSGADSSPHSKPRRDSAPQARSHPRKAFESDSLTTSGDPSYLGIEASLYLGTLKRKGACSASIHILPLREGCILIDNIYIYDSVHGSHYRLSQPYEIFAV